MNKYRWSLALAAVVVLAFTLLLVARRTDPLPKPNGYDDFVAAGRMIVGEPWNMRTNDPISMATFAGDNTGVVTRVRAGLARESRVPVRMNPEWFGGHTRELMAVGRVGSTLRLLAWQSQAEGHLAEPIALHLDRIRLGIGAARGGLLLDYRVGTTIELEALQDIRKLTSRLGPVLCRKIIQTLPETESNREPLSSILHRDRRWTWLASGWWRSWEDTKAMLKEVLGDDDENTASLARMSALEVKILEARYNLSLTLARRAFTLEQGRPPATDAELVPRYLPALPPVALPSK